MLRSEAIAIIKRGLGFRQTQDAAIVSALQEAQRDLERGQTLPDWMLATQVPLTMVSTDVGIISLPPGFIRVHEDFPPFYLNTDGNQVFINKMSNVDIVATYGGTARESIVANTPRGYPEVYQIISLNFFCFTPAPDFTLTVYCDYYKGGDILTTEIENIWLKYAPNYLIGLAGMKVAGDLRDKGALDRFTKMAQIANKSYLGDIVEDELAGRPLIMGRNN